MRDVSLRVGGSESLLLDVSFIPRFSRHSKCLSNNAILTGVQNIVITIGKPYTVNNPTPAMPSERRAVSQKTVVVAGWVTSYALKVQPVIVEKIPQRGRGPPLLPCLLLAWRSSSPWDDRSALRTILSPSPQADVP
jgi:hypothetical protein